jgi:hypothetical protein
MTDVIDVPADIEPCGCAIEDLEELIYLRAADLVTEWELADPRDAWRHTGEPAPAASIRNSDVSAKPANAPQPYRTSQVTEDAFWFVVGLNDPDRLKAWMRDHPKDAPTLLKLLESK